MANLGSALLAANRKADIRITAHNFSYIRELDMTGDRYGIQKRYPLLGAGSITKIMWEEEPTQWLSSQNSQSQKNGSTAAS
ncbi:uncharacterized protein IAS62_005109 [Cryptococcus decagattii]|uniref:Uncharacterized protein n=1 Tax=Cryptococcus decagattii TaxID=1859122 RepID=A0ABZ2AYZ2_9TREE